MAAGELRVRDGWQILTDWPRLSGKATKMLQAMVAAAPAGTVVSDTYRGKHRGLMLYGPGSPMRLPFVRSHVAQGGRVAMWDMGYWERKEAMRLSIDSLHPTPAQLDMAPTGPGRREFELREDADPAGPIMLVGLGPKSVFAYGLRSAHLWERAKVKDLQRRFPGREIVWRPKGSRPLPLLGLRMSHGQHIEEAMRGCSLVVSHHSNCSVDAVVAGVPFETEGGAALWFAGREFTRENRAEFLRLLSWWEWRRDEAPAAWKWIEKATA
jgi:hypothetical protein